MLGSFFCFVATDIKTGPIFSSKSGGDAKGVKDAESIREGNRNKTSHFMDFIERRLSAPTKSGRRQMKQERKRHNGVV